MADKKYKIVMVEDDMAMREIISHKLSTAGFDIKAGEDGKKGLDLILKEKPDLVMLDLMLPELSGFQILDILRGNKDQSIAKTPVIVLSNLWSNEDILKAKVLNAQAFLVKAYFTPNEILEKIKEVLANPAVTIS